MRTRKEIDAEIAKVRAATRLIIHKLLNERANTPETPRGDRRGDKLPPMTHYQRTRYKYLMRHEGMTRDEALAALGLGPAVFNTPTDRGTSPAGDHTAPAGALSSQRRDH